MPERAIPPVVLAAYIVPMRWVLPKFGVPTARNLAKHI
jgi:hypothetical protein